MECLVQQGDQVVLQHGFHFHVLSVLAVVCLEYLLDIAYRYVLLQANPMVKVVICVFNRIQFICFPLRIKIFPYL